MKTKTTRIGIALTLALLLAVALGLVRGVAYADDGDLDFGFGGGDGLVTTNFQDTIDEARAVAFTDGLGSSVAVGTTHISGNDYDFSVARYDSVGSLDTNFGGGDGMVTTDFYDTDDQAYAVAIQQGDGKIVVAGTMGPYGPHGSYMFAVARYTTNGSLDYGFSHRYFPIGNGNEPETSIARGVAIQQNNGKITLAGHTTRGGSTDFALIRLNPDGSLDTTFGGGDGKVTTDFFGGVDEVRSVALQFSGTQIVVAGNAQVSGSNYDFAFARYNPDGSLDNTFSGDGKATVDFFGGDDGANALALQNDHKIVAAGGAYYEPSTWSFGVVRLLSNGNPDPDFGSGGIKIEDLGAGGIDEALSVAIEPDGNYGKVVVAGYAPVGGVNRFALARFTTNGILDGSFGGGDGWLTTGFGGGVALGYHVAIGSGDRIMVAGTAYMGEPNSYDYALARYLSNGHSNPTATPPVMNTPTRTPTDTSVPTQTPGGPTATPQATPTTCPIQFPDVPPGSTFYDFVRCLACQGIVSGYANGTFGPNNPVTRGQLSKIVANSANYQENHTTQHFQDVGVGSTFYLFIARLYTRSHISGYSCGGAGEPCVPPQNLPYFRSNANVTRGQTSKIVASAHGLPAPPPGQRTFEDVLVGSTFWEWIESLAATGAISGYACGSPEPCVSPGNLPYFRPNNQVTRGQSAKIVANAFSPGCVTP